MLREMEDHPLRVRTWREFWANGFIRLGQFSLRPLPKSQAEEAEEASKAEREPLPKDATRLNLDT